MNAIATQLGKSSVRVLQADDEVGDYLGTGVEAEWIKTGFSTPLGDCQQWHLDFSPQEQWFDVTEQTDIDYRNAIDDHRQFWFVWINVNINRFRSPFQPNRALLRAKCVEVVRVNCRTLARFELEYRT